jgi:hypothetical protein
MFRGAISKAATISQKRARRFLSIIIDRADGKHLIANKHSSVC